MRLCTLIALCLLAWGCYTAKSAVYASRMPPNCQEQVCIVTYSAGGYLDAFQRLGEAIRVEKRLLIIDGPCVSACTVMADIARPYVCVTERAVMFIHQGMELATGERFEVDYSRDIARWIRRHGGQPTYGFLPMFHDDMLEFWVSCNLLHQKGAPKG